VLGLDLWWDRRTGLRPGAAPPPAARRRRGSAEGGASSRALASRPWPYPMALASAEGD